ncbi:hypothetical protein MNBD_PLANCTO02-1974 [hydrothermal vent metagenome]|uniref:Uncharacterized protein n=1 Tax=hydrothermal vent metagenome TaxID=652676 RepID=A0A3B1DEA3_9ZZZZ
MYFNHPRRVQYPFGCEPLYRKTYCLRLNLCCFPYFVEKDIMRSLGVLQFSRFSILFSSIIALLFFSSGCEKKTLVFTETKRIGEKVSEKELSTFLRVIKSLPGKKLPRYPSVYAPPPHWNFARTLPVGELMYEERNLIAQRWKTKWQADNLPQSRALKRALKRQKMSKEQFVSLATAIGMALSRNQIREKQDLDAIRRVGTVAIAKLNANEKPFSEHSLDQQYEVLNNAVWLIRIDRVNHLLLVPPENIALVQKHLKTLEKVFPKEYTANPLDGIADILHEQGLPFEENKQAGNDADIGWNRATAIIGHDPL